MALFPRHRYQRLYRRSFAADDGAKRPVKIDVMVYSRESVTETHVGSPDDLKRLDEDRTVTWINVDSLTDVGIINLIGKMFGLHSLALEDVGHQQQPKIEAYHDHMFFLLRAPVADDKVATEQVAMFVGKDFVLTFGEHPGDCFESIRAQIRKDGSRIRESGADYLAYALVDSIVDAFFPVLESFGEEVEEVETEIFQHARPRILRRIHLMKQDMMALRRIAWSHREIANRVVRDTSPHFSEQVRIFFRDCYDHAVNQIDLIETYREVAFGLIEIYQTEITMKVNEVMRVLTVIATIFLPLGFIASLYGMNFDRESPFNMPELGWRFGYFFALGIMAVVAIGMLIYFGRRGWLRSTLPPSNTFPSSRQSPKVGADKGTEKGGGH
jgi:magnesium transporter